MARNEGYALLYTTIKDDSTVDKTLIIKTPNPEIAALIKSIAQFCREAKTRLDTFAREDSSLDLKDQGLPEVEASTRAAIRAATTKQILSGGGKVLEVNLLLTQYDALNYVSHLAETLSKQDDNDARQRFLLRIAKDSEGFNEQVVALLTVAGK